MEQIVMEVGGMSCQGCVKNINGVLGVLDGVASAEVSLEAAQAKVAFDPLRVSRAALLEAIEDAGFDVI